MRKYIYKFKNIMISCFSGFPEFPSSILNEGFLKVDFFFGGGGWNCSWEAVPPEGLLQKVAVGATETTYAADHYSRS